jgi:hypothetical protein
MPIQQSTLSSSSSSSSSDNAAGRPRTLQSSLDSVITQMHTSSSSMAQVLLAMEANKNQRHRERQQMQLQIISVLSSLGEKFINAFAKSGQ